MLEEQQLKGILVSGFQEVMIDLDKGLFPFFEEPISCGFPSPAESHIKKRLSLKDLFQEKPSVFFLEAVGNSMINAGIKTGSILVCDKGAIPKNNSVVVCVLNGKFMVKRFKIRVDGTKYLKAENALHPTIEIMPEDELLIEAVVTHSVSRL